MKQERSPYNDFKERLITAIIITVLVISYESSWFNTVGVTSFRLQETTLD